MNKDAIKKALEYCAGDSIDDCKNCPYANNGPFACSISMYKDAHTLITKQEKEIEQFKTSNQNAIDKINKLQKEINALQEENRRLDEYVSCTLSAQEFDEEIKQAKIDVLNRLKSLSIYDDNYLDGYVFIDDIEKLLEELKK